MNSRGFSLVEALVATAILTLIVGAVFDAVNPMHGTFQAQPEAADEQQRLRVAIATIATAIRTAGAGSLVGSSRGPLIRSLPPVLPYRIGESRPDAASGVRYRPDVIALVSVPRTAAQVTLRDAVARGATVFTVTLPSSCPPATATSVCGFSAGTRALVYDGRGVWDAITITVASGNTLEFVRPGGLSSAYPSGTAVTEAVIRVYSLRPDATGTFQLSQYDGFQSELPVVEHVVSLNFEYFGEPEAPRRLGAVPLDATPGPWTTYGPYPPPLDRDDADDTWPMGENCVFRADGVQQLPRLPDLAADRNLVRLSEDALTDGPWCPDPASPDAYDADLLRIRLVRTRLRVQVASAALRGPSGALFRFGGWSNSGERFVPDQQIEFDVTPPNMAAGR